MKKLNLKWTAVVAIAVLIGAAVLTSCSKEEVFEPNVSEASPQLKREKITNNLRWFVIDGTGDYDCDGTGGNCFADVIVTPSSLFREILTVE